MPERAVDAADERVYPRAAPGRCPRTKGGGSQRMDLDRDHRSKQESDHAETAGITHECHGVRPPFRRSRRPQGAELAETTGAGTGLAARVALAPGVALGHVAVGGVPERR